MVLMNSFRNTIMRILISLLLIVAAISAATGRLEILIHKSGAAIINDANNKYLNEAFDRSLKGFLVLSAVKSGVAVLEGSEIGVGFNLQVGDIAQSIYDYVDIAWKSALAGGTVLLLIRLMLQTVQLLDHWCLFALVVMGLALFLRYWIFPKHERLNRLFKEGFLVACILTAALYLILPISIAGASFLSKQITVPLVEEAYQGFECLQHDLSPQALNERFFPDGQGDDSLWSRFDLKAKIQHSRSAVMEMVEYLKRITDDFAVWTIKILAGYLFDCLIFPLAFFIIVYIITKNFLVYVIGIRRSDWIRKDVEKILAETGKTRSP